MRSSSHALVAPDRAISPAVMNCALGLSGGGLDERKYAQPLRASALRASEEAAILERRNPTSRFTRTLPVRIVPCSSTRHSSFLTPEPSPEERSQVQKRLARRRIWFLWGLRYTDCYTLHSIPYA